MDDDISSEQAVDSPIVASAAVHFDKNVTDTPNTVAAKEFKETIVNTVNTGKLANMLQRERKAASEDLARLRPENNVGSDKSVPPKAVSAPDQQQAQAHFSYPSSTAPAALPPTAAYSAYPYQSDVHTMPIPSSGLAQAAAPVEEDEFIGSDTMSDEEHAMPAATATAPPQPSSPGAQAAPNINTGVISGNQAASPLAKQIDSVLGTAPASPNFNFSTINNGTANSPPKNSPSPKRRGGGAKQSSPKQSTNPGNYVEEPVHGGVTAEDLHTDDEEEDKEEEKEAAQPRADKYEDTMTEDEVLNEKTDIMNDIKDYISLGVVPPTKPLFSMNLRMLRRIRQVMAHKHEETIGVGFLGVGFIELMGGIERVNTKYDPVAKVLGTGLKLQGMGATVEKKIEKYRIPFQRIYRKYVRNLFSVGGGGGGSMSPFLQMAFITAAIAGKTHKKNLRKEMARTAHEASRNPDVINNAIRVMGKYNDVQNRNVNHQRGTADIAGAFDEEEDDEDAIATEEEYEDAEDRDETENGDGTKENEEEEDDDDVPARKPPMPLDQGEPMYLNTRKNAAGLSNVGYAGKINMTKRMAQYEQNPPIKHVTNDVRKAPAAATVNNKKLAATATTTTTASPKPSPATSTPPTAVGPRGPFRAMTQLTHPTTPFDPSNAPDGDTETDGGGGTSEEEEDVIQDIY